MFTKGFTKIALNAQKARELAKQYGLVPEGAWKWGLRNLRQGRTPQQLGMAPKKMVDAARRIGADVESGALWGKGVSGGIGQLGQGAQAGYLFGGTGWASDFVKRNKDTLFDGKISSGKRKLDLLGKLNNDYLKIQRKFHGMNTLHTHPAANAELLGIEKDMAKAMRNPPPGAKDLMQQSLETQYGKALAQRLSKGDLSELSAREIEKRHSSAYPNLMPSGFKSRAPYNTQGSDQHAMLQHNIGTHHNIVDDTGVGVHTVRPGKEGKRFRSLIFQDHPKASKK